MIVAFGNSSGEETTFNVSDFYGRGTGARIYAFLLFHELARKGGAGKPLRTLAELIQSGGLKTEISLRGELRQPHDALQALMDRRVAGKAVFVVA